MPSRREPWYAACCKTLALRRSSWKQLDDAWEEQSSDSETGSTKSGTPHEIWPDALEDGQNHDELATLCSCSKIAAAAADDDEFFSDVASSEEHDDDDDDEVAEEEGAEEEKEGGSGEGGECGRGSDAQARGCSSSGVTEKQPLPQPSPPAPPLPRATAAPPPPPVTAGVEVAAAELQQQQQQHQQQRRRRRQQPQPWESCNLPLEGRWVCTSTWGLEDFLRKSGFSRVQRLAAVSAPWPEWDFEQHEDDRFVFLNRGALGDIREEFTVGGPEYYTKDGWKQTVRSRAFWEDDVLVIERDGPQGCFREERRVDINGKLQFCLHSLKAGTIAASWGRTFKRKL